jgi:hypothetical protein
VKPLNLRILLSFAAGLFVAAVLYQPLVAQKNAQIAHLEVEILRAETIASQATGILHHERLMRLGLLPGIWRQYRNESGVGNEKVEWNRTARRRHSPGKE